MRTDEQSLTAAGTALARHGWGTRRLDSLLGELEGRVDELDAEQVARLVGIAEAARDRSGS